jgi:FAD/FMN-containing dehydrogenase
MMLPNCTYQFCNVNGKRKSNRPAYTVMVMTEQDISVALQFANRYNIPVTVKTTGHSEYQ